MTKAELEAIAALQGSQGFNVIQKLIKDKMDKLKDVTLIDRTGLVAEQALARQLAYEVLENFLNDINLLPKGDREISKTYE